MPTYIPIKHTYTVKTIAEQLNNYDAQKGIRRKFFKDLESIAQLRQFYNQMPDNQSSRLLTNNELFQLFQILISTKLESGHLSEKIFNNLKESFNLDVMSNLLSLKKENLLSLDNFNLVISHQQYEAMTNAIIALHYDETINTEKNWLALKIAKNPANFIDSLKNNQKISSFLSQFNVDWKMYQPILEKLVDLPSLITRLNNLNSKEDIENVLKHADPLKMASALVFLNQNYLSEKSVLVPFIEKMNDPLAYLKTLDAENTILNLIKETEFNREEYIQLIKKHFNIVALRDSLTLLDAKNLIPTYFNDIIHHQNPKSLAKAILFLENEKEINTLENLQTAKNAKKPFKFVKSFKATQFNLNLLKKNHLSQAEYIQIVKNHPAPDLLKSALLALESFNLIKDKYFKIVAYHANPQSMAMGIIIFQFLAMLPSWSDKNAKPNIPDDKLELIKQEDDPGKVAFAIAFQQAMNFIAGNAILTFIINKISQFLDTDLMKYCNDLVQESLVSSINFSQNTHIESVYQSASDSALRLQAKYQDKLNLEVQRHEILKWANNLNNKFPQVELLKLKSVKTAAENILNSVYVYYDPRSKISLLKLLMLTWVAIHDQDFITCDKTTAENLFIDALYEIQRGDNLDQDNQDDKLDDKTICHSGAFNKFIEKLDGIHPDAKLIVITKLTASWKLPPIVNQAIIDLVGKPNNQQQLNDTLVIIKKLELQGVAGVWEDIKQKVSEKMFDEFGSLFTGKEDPDFINLIEQGKIMMFVGLEELKNEITNSPVIKKEEVKLINNSTLFSRSKTDFTKTDDGYAFQLSP